MKTAAELTMSAEKLIKLAQENTDLSLMELGAAFRIASESVSQSHWLNEAADMQTFYRNERRRRG